jgi:hypothetical protein
VKVSYTKVLCLTLFDCSPARNKWRRSSVKDCDVDCAMMWRMPSAWYSVLSHPSPSIKDTHSFIPTGWSFSSPCNDMIIWCTV